MATMKTPSIKTGGCHKWTTWRSGLNIMVDSYFMDDGTATPGYYFLKNKDGVVVGQGKYNLPLFEALRGLL